MLMRRRNFRSFRASKIVSMNRKKFAEKRREMSQKSIEELIETLRGEDLQIRFFAEMCLRDATNT